MQIRFNLASCIINYVTLIMAQDAPTSVPITYISFLIYLQSFL